MVNLSLRPKDRAFFDLFNQAGENALRAARLLDELIAKLPEGQEGFAREILIAEQDGDRITHDVIQRINTMFVTPLDREDIYALATGLDDVVDYVEEAADLLGLYRIEAPMEQAREMSKVLVSACEQLAKALAGLRGLHGIEPYWIEIHRLENDADRISRDAVASLFANGTDPMVVIRWKDIFAVLEHAVDATESAAHTIEGIVIKNA